MSARSLLFLFSFFSAALWARPIEFSADDFPPSPYALEHTQRHMHEGFPTALSIWSNQAIELLKTKKAPRELLLEIAQWRHSLASNSRGPMEATQENRYGILRWIGERPHEDQDGYLQSSLGAPARSWGGLSTSSKSVKELEGDPKHSYEWASRAQSFLKKKEAKKSDDSRLLGEHSLMVAQDYRLSSDQVVELFHVKVTFDQAPSPWDSARNVSLFSASTSVAKKIYAEFWGRLDKKVKGAKSPEDFSSLIQAYFASMFFSRGTAAIGRAFWAAVLSHQFERKILLHPEVDLYALTSTPEEFQELVEVWTQQRCQEAFLKP